MTVQIFALDGRMMREITVGALKFGRHQVVWDGRDESGLVVPPGLYLVQVNVVSDKGLIRRGGSVALVY